MTKPIDEANILVLFCYVSFTEDGRGRWGCAAGRRI
jgi:hypothetical protein